MKKYLNNNRAKGIRHLLGWSLSQVVTLMEAEYKIVTSVSAISNFENKKSVYWKPFREKLADLYGVSLEYLDGTDE